jgi:hypothetical protein
MRQPQIGRPFVTKLESVSVAADVSSPSDRSRRAPRFRCGRRSLNDMVRSYLESLAGQAADQNPAEELLRLLKERPGNSGGWRFNPEEIYEERLEELERRRKQNTR